MVPDNPVPEVRLLDGRVAEGGLPYAALREGWGGGVK